jgi:hypothetical protein
MGWFAFRRFAQLINRGKIKTVLIKARKKPIPARTVMYCKMLIEKIS